MRSVFNKENVSSLPQQFQGVTVMTKANIYFEGKVLSHTLLFPDGTRKTLGLIHPCAVYFGTERAERMEIVSGECRIQREGQSVWENYAGGQTFEIPAQSGFHIEVKQGLCEYICTYL